MKGQLHRFCNDNEFERLLEADSDDWYSWPGLKYFLYEYEIHLASQRGASPNVGWYDIHQSELRYTIEHILPQTIDNVHYWSSRFSESAHQKHIHDLGNLALTKHNSHYGNKPFPEKRGTLQQKSPCYTTSPLHIERELANWSDWEADAITERRQMLIEWANDRWYVDFTEVIGELISDASNDFEENGVPDEIEFEEEQDL